MQVKISILAKLPPGAKVYGSEDILDMFGDKRHAMIVGWIDNTGFRKAHFCIDSAEYLGEC